MSPFGARTATKPGMPSIAERKCCSLSRNASSARVTLWDHHSYPADKVWVAPDDDIAVVHIQAPADKLHPIPIGSSTCSRKALSSRGTTLASRSGASGGPNTSG